MKLLFLTLLLGLPFIVQSQQTLETIEVEGVQRTYYRYLPTGYIPGENLPVIVVLHGIGDNALNMSGVGFNQMADTARFIPVYLQGKQNVWAQNSWNNGTLLASDVNDILFISMVIDELEDSFDIDLSRVYMTGFSMGGIMCYTTCSQLSDRIAAMASFSGTMSVQETGASGQQYPVPTLHCHGTADTQVPYDGTALPSLSLVKQTMDKNKTLNGWQGDSIVYNIPDNVSDGVTIEKIVYNTTTPLEHWKMNGADHIWPYQPANDTSAIFVAWNFFVDKSHPNPSTASLKMPDNETALNVYPNPVNDQMKIVVDLAFADKIRLTILDVSGKELEVIHDNEMQKGSTIVDYRTSALPSGMYFLQISGLTVSKTVKFIKQ